MAELALGMVAGEVSGDLLAASVLAGLRADGASLIARGIGGPEMSRQGFESWWTIDALSVRGYAEVLRALPRLLRMRATLRDRMIEWRPRLFVGVDAPDFNLGLEASLRQAGLKTAHFIGPSVWAWRRERLSRIRESVDHMLLVFPFEKPIYDEAGIASTYVGHPLADKIPLSVDREAARRSLGLPEGTPVIALMPGSRPDEIRYMADEFLACARWLAQRRPDLCFVLPAASAELFDGLRRRIARPGIGPVPELRLVLGRSHDVLAAADVALIASGTATLEAALFRRPMVIAYKMAALSYRLMRDKGYLPWIGLPNILCGDAVVPEFVQHEANAPAMGQALLEMLDDAARREAIGRRFEALHHDLRQDCATRSANLLRELAR